MNSQHSGLCWYSVALALAAAAGCDGAARPGDGGADAGSDGDAPTDGGTDGDADVPTPPPCEPGTLVCGDGAVHECAADGTPGELVRDCAALPFDTCEVGSCGALDEPEGGCCVADEPFCHATVDVEGKDTVTVDYLGLWVDDFACAGSIAEDGYNWSLWARMPACTGPFVRVILSGYLDGWEAGGTFPLCQDGLTVPDIRVSVTADQTTYGNADPAVPPSGACERVTGTITFHEYGSAGGEPFHISIDGALVDPATGETRALQVDSHGVLLDYPS